MSLIVDIIHAINRNGRQGPRDLMSREVYDWVVAAGVNIDYDDYAKLLCENSIEDSERATRRDAYFTVSRRGQYSFFKSREFELRAYVCAVLAREPGLTSDKIIRRVKLLYPGVTPVDMMIQQNIASPQEILDQTIRNILVSNYERQANLELFTRSFVTPYVYRLTPQGEALAATVDMVADEEPEPDAGLSAVPYSESELRELEARQSNSPPRARTEKGRVFFPADPRLKATRKALARHRCELDASHETFPTETGEMYTEGHHIIPMEAQKCYPDIHLDCLENLVALCPTCHRAVHYGREWVRGRIIGRLVAARSADFARIGLDEDAVAELMRLYYGIKI